MTEAKEQRREPHVTLAVFAAIGFLGPIAGGLLNQFAELPRAAGYAIGAFAVAALAYPFLRRAMRSDGITAPTFLRWMGAVGAGVAGGLLVALLIGRL